MAQVESIKQITFFLLLGMDLAKASTKLQAIKFERLLIAVRLKF